MTAVNSAVATAESSPFFTVVVASRNRPQLLQLALDSIFAQSCQDFEVVLVNDGSDPEHLDAMQMLIERHPGRIRRIDLVRYPRGHGQSYSLNTGAFAGSGQYLTFLDDDDFWTDSAHLETARQALQQFPDADAYYANQLAVQAGQEPASGQVLWLGDCEARCQEAGLQRQHGVYSVDVAVLMRCSGFAHLNCSIVRRELFLAIGGMDEDIRWECDRDFFLRSIDRARRMLFNPDVVSRHNVPDKTKNANMTTAISVYQRLNYQIYVLNKAAMLARNRLIVEHAQQHKVYALKKVAEALLAEQRYPEALYFSAQSLGAGRSWRWLGRHLQMRWQKWRG